MALADVAEVLGGEHVLRQPLHHRLDLIALSRKGIPKVALVHLAHFLSSWTYVLPGHPAFVASNCAQAMYKNFRPGT